MTPSPAPPSSCSDFAASPGSFIPIPNRAGDLDFSRFASFQRKGEALGYIEELLLVWLRDQARYTLDPDVDLAKLNLASRILYRLTAIQKTMLAIDALLQAQRNNDPLGARTSASVTPTDNQPAPPLSGNADAPVLTQSPNPQPSPSDDLPAPAPATPSPTTAPTAANDLSALAAPHSALAVRAVAVCPTLSLDDLDSYLDRTEADLAQALGSTPSNPPPSHSSNSSNPQSTFPAPPSSSPHSALRTPPCSGPCIQCVEPFCATRLAVPFHHPSRPLKKCDGTCRVCAKTRACPFTPAYLRPG